MTNPIQFDATKSNMHPVDQLVELRLQIRFLQEKADALRDYILENKDDNVGDIHEAYTVTSSRKMLNRSKLEEKFGDLSDYTDEITGTSVRTKLRKGKKVKS